MSADESHADRIAGLQAAVQAAWAEYRALVTPLRDPAQQCTGRAGRHQRAALPRITALGLEADRQRPHQVRVHAAVQAWQDADTALRNAETVAASLPVRAQAWRERGHTQMADSLTAQGPDTARLVRDARKEWDEAAAEVAAAHQNLRRIVAGNPIRAGQVVTREYVDMVRGLAEDLDHIEASDARKRFHRAERELLSAGVWTEGQYSGSAQLWFRPSPNPSVVSDRTEHRPHGRGIERSR